MIEVAHVSKFYCKRSVLQHASCSIPRGSFALLVGQNGAGKSTLLRMMAGVEFPDCGRIAICGYAEPVRNLRARRSLAYLPQSPQFHPRFTCAQLVVFYARLRGVSASLALDELDCFGLAAEQRMPTAELSGGMRQRLGIAILCASQAPVLLIDEPALSLDQYWRQVLIKRLRAEADAGKSILVTSHLLAEWENAADMILECRDEAIQSIYNRTNLKHSAASALLTESYAECSHIESAKECAKDALSLSSQSARSFLGLMRREVRSALFDRHLQVFSALALAGGVGTTWFGATIEVVIGLTLQGVLYFVPVFALLLGISSAHAESMEWPTLLSQPFKRSFLPLAKFVTNAVILMLALLLFLLPSVVNGIPVGMIAAVIMSGSALAFMFLALGLCCGVRLRDRARALMGGLLSWLALYLAFDAVALALAHLPVVWTSPDVWTALLMANPVDALRIHSLFTLEGLTPEDAAASPLSSWWLAHTGHWLATITILWSAVLIAAATKVLPARDNSRN